MILSYLAGMVRFTVIEKKSSAGFGAFSALCGGKKVVATKPAVVLVQTTCGFDRDHTWFCRKPRVVSARITCGFE
ncbi:hypothetical protein [Prolixibacter sp. NT017]|uniref:hypothetical protein n=1 Tax=Prolixibacter sp. NT017 TaxID=2652390 RepID=UPI001298F126|nr:hypothetical protein [Prolixibacter sp. NT017]